jgi:transposase
MRGKIRRLEQALECSFFTDEHAAVLAMMLAVIDHHTAQISQLTTTIEKLAEPWLHQIEQLDAVPGIGAVCVQDIIAEIGTDMAVFPTASHLVSWARFSPRSGSPPGNAKAATPPAAATPTSAPRSARPASAPATPSRSSAPGTGS